MKDLPPPERLSDAAKGTLIHAVWQRVQDLEQRLQDREGQSATPTAQRVKKTPKNSSQPPLQGFQANINAPASRSECRSASERRSASVGQLRGGRELGANPDPIVIARAKQGPHGGAGGCASSQKLSAVYERLERPPVRVQVTRVERYGGICDGCQQFYESPVPVGLEPGSPYGASIARVLSYLRYPPAVSDERLRPLIADLYTCT